MKTLQRFSYLSLLIGLTLLFVLWQFPPAITQALPTLQTPSHKADQAWQLAADVGVFEFRTSVEQELRPAPRVTNVGKPPRYENMYLEGNINQPKERMNLTLYLPRENPNNPNDGLEILIEEGKSLARAGKTGAWEAMEEDVASVFAPGGDPLGFLVAAKNVQEIGTETRTIPGVRSQESGVRSQESGVRGQDSGVRSQESGSGSQGANDSSLNPESKILNPDSQITFTKYAFDFDGLQFGNYMRTELEKQLRAKGELPPSINLETPQIYKQTEGQGEIWIDSDGLPLRLTIDLDFPRLEEGADQIKASIKTDYFNYDRAKLAQATATLSQSPLAWLAHRNPWPQTATQWHQTALSITTWALLAAAFALAITYMHTRRFYQVVATTVIISMVGLPLIQAFQVQAYGQKQQIRTEEQKAEREEQEAYQTLQAEMKQPEIDPHTGVRIQESGVRSQDSGVRSQDSGVRSQDLGVGRQEVEEMEGQVEQNLHQELNQPKIDSNTGVRSQESGVRSQETNTFPLNPESRIQNPESKGDYDNELIQRTQSMAEGNQLGNTNLSGDQTISQGGDVRTNLSNEASRRIDTLQYSGGVGTGRDEGIHSLSENSEGFFARTGNTTNYFTQVDLSQTQATGNLNPTNSANWQNAEWADSQSSQEVEDGSQELGVRSQELGYRSQDTGVRSQGTDDLNTESQTLNPESRLLTPDSQTPNPESRLLNPESRLLNPESRLLNPESRLLTPAPVLFLTFDESNGSTSFNDSSGYNNTATCSGITCPTAGTTAVYNTGLDFDGNDDYLSISHSSELSIIGDMTIALWVEPSNWYNGKHTPFVVKGNGSSSNANYYFGTWTNGGLKLSYYNNGWQDIRDNSGVSYNNGTSYHLALVIDVTNNQVQFYRNGSLLSSHTQDFSAKPMLANSNDLNIGQYLNSSNGNFAGVMDEVMIFDQALTVDDIDALYNLEPSISNDELANTDTDGDGLSDADELDWGTCAQATNCTGTDTLDYDGDGLSDGAEVNELGTDPTQADSDGDTIDDNLEVAGFSYNNQTWYLDPTNVDTNKDGIMDGFECKAFSNLSETNTTVCEDTDQDGTPDVWDDDNDGDGVHDSVDLSPQKSMGQNNAYTEDNPFLLQINNFETDKPLFVDVQLRPTDPDHLSHLYHVFDWPDNDINGQIQRKLNTTFYDTATSVQSSAANADFGDMRLIPMLKINVPYQTQHYANLPTINNPAPFLETTSLTAWLDTATLQAYGISASKEADDSGNITLYAPLSLVEDETGGGQSAFTTRIPYWPAQDTWGNTHEYQLVWMVQMITDVCIDADGDGEITDENSETCQREETATVIHIYDDEFYITGLQTIEDHGLKVALIAEDPGATTPTDYVYEEGLWATAVNLSLTFIEGTDCAQQATCTPDNQRDVTIDTLSTYISNWVTETTMISVTKSYTHEGYLSHVMMTDTLQLLENNFSNYQDTYPTVLFAREMTQRSLNMDDTVITDTLVMNLDPAEVSLQTVAQLNWSPYYYASTANTTWVNYDIDEYWNYLGNKLKNLDDFQPTDNSDEAESIATGFLLYTQFTYLAFYQGLTSLVEMDNEPLQPSIDADLTNPFVGQYAHNSIFAIFANFYISELIDSSGLNLEGDELYKWFGDLAETVDGDHFYELHDLDEIKALLSYKGSKASKIIVGASIVSVVGLTVTALIINPECSGLAKCNFAYVALTGFDLAQSVKELVSLVGKVSRAFNTTSSIGKLRALKLVTKADVKAGVISLVIDIAVTWGTFAYLVISTGATGIAFNVLLAGAIAATIVSIILFIIYLIPIVGVFIVLLISIIDALITLICTIAESSAYACNGLVGMFIDQLSKFIYQVDDELVDFTNKDRLEFAFSNISYIGPQLGFIALNGVQYTLDITNTLKSGQFTPGTLQAAFAYTLGTQKIDGHDNLELGDLADKWFGFGPSLKDTTVYGTFTTTNQPPVYFANVGTGINQNLSPFYLNEAFHLPYEGCWVGFIDCEYETLAKDTNHINLGPFLMFDILPNTLSEFVALANVGSAYTLAWSQNSGKSFKRQLDADNDGLINKIDGGPDPNDSNWDTDGDTLSDKAEFELGTDPQSADSDSDGLNDAFEIYHGTDPWLADTDNDGLDDATELTGWLISYTDSTGSLQTTWAWSNPWLPDADNDTLNDFDEYVFGFNPNVKTDADAILNAMTYDDISLSEDKAPVLMLPFEDTANLTIFSDSSGYANHATCASQSSCPISTQNGVYGNARTFDGVDDYLDIADTADINDKAATTQRTLAAWFKVDDKSINTRKQVIIEEGGAARGLAIYIYNNTLYVSGWNTPDDEGDWEPTYITTTAIQSNQWHHVSLVLSGTDTLSNDALKAYLDGQPIGSTPATQLRDHNPVAIGAVNADSYFHDGAVTNEPSHFFGGTIDEVTLLNKALSQDEVQALMSGVYNFNDLIVAPGDTLSYNLTAQNNLNSRSIAGVINLEQVDDPWLNLSTSLLFMDFEESELGSFSNNANGYTYATCNLNSCPTVGVTGYSNNAVQFDGLDDYIETESPSIYKLGFNEEEGILYGSWVYLTENKDMTILAFQNDAGAIYSSLGYDATEQNFYHYSDSNGYSYFGHNVSLNQWYFLELVLDTKGFGGYNKAGALALSNQAGELLDSSTGKHFVGLPYPNLSNKAKAYQGATWNGSTTTNHFKGKMDGTFLSYGTNLLRISVQIVSGGGSITYYTFNPENATKEIEFLFDETSLSRIMPDSSLYNHQGQCTDNTCPTTSITGYFSNATTFDGLNDAITLIDENSFDLNEITVSAWIKVNQFDKNWQAIVTKGNSAWRLHRFGANNTISFDATGLSTFSIAGQTNINDGNWHHVAGVYDGNYLYLFVDGVLDANPVPSSGTISTNNYPVMIGENAEFTGRYFNGSIDNVMIFNTALITTEIQTLMTQSEPPFIVDTALKEFELAAASSDTINGSIQVNQATTTGHYGLDIQADAAVVVPDDISSRFSFPDLNLTFENSTLEDTTTAPTFSLECPQNTDCATLSTTGLNNGKGLTFNGSSESLMASTLYYGQVPNIADNNYTLSAWVYPTHSDTNKKRGIIGSQGWDIIGTPMGVYSFYDSGSTNQSINNWQGTRDIDYKDVYYAFRLAIRDISGQNNYIDSTPTCYSDCNYPEHSTLLADEDGLHGKALYFSGQSNAQSFSKDLFNGSSPAHMAFGAWVRPASNDNRSGAIRILSFYHDGGGYSNEVSIVYNPATGKYGCHNHYGSSSNWIWNSTEYTNKQYPKGQTHHVALIWLNSTMSLYVDGVNTNTDCYDEQVSPDMIFYLAENPADNTFFKGYIDDVFVFDLFNGVTDTQLQVITNTDTLYIYNGTSYPSFYMANGTTLGFAYNNGNGWLEQSTGYNLALNAWNHLALTVQDTNYYIYANGTLVYQGSVNAGEEPRIGKRLSLGWVGPNYDYFQGNLDYITLYDTPLSEDEIISLANLNGALSTQETVLYVPFDDTPGSTTFQNLIWEETLSCETEDTCPIAGVLGKANRAIYFDGEDDYIVDTDWGTAEYGLQSVGSEMSLSMWINGEGGTLFDNDNYIVLSMDNLRVGTEILDFAAMPRNEWHHVVLTKNSNNVYTVYLNGVQLASGTFNSYTFADTIYFGTSSTLNAYKGYMDDLRVHNYTLSASQVQILYQETSPQLNLELDEETEAETVNDSSSNAYAGIVLGAETGATGRIENSLYLDGNSYVEVQDATAINNLSDSFTVMAWVNAEELSSYRRILAHSRTNSGNGFGFGANGKKLRFTTFGVKDYDTTTDLLSTDTWYHVAAVMDANYDVSFYVDGEFVQKINGTNPVNLNTDDPLYIGATTTGNASSETFKGRIDELKVYNRVLSSIDIENIYRTEYRWFRDSTRFNITVDTDPPNTIELVSDFSHRPNQYTLLQVNTRDETSNIPLLKMGIKHNTATDYTWSYPSACEGSEGVAWCPEFDPTALNGEGRYELIFSAIDAVGNVATSTVYTLYVDDTAPVLSASYSDTPLVASLSDTQESTWLIPLSGTISDPTLSSGDAGSGVATTTLTVKLFDGQGNLAGLSAQQATVTNNTWAINYEVVGQTLAGPYTITLTAEDVVGNQTTTDVGTILLDTNAPQIDWYNQSVNTTTITSTLTLSGLVVDHPAEDDPLLDLHFAENTGATTFYDSSGYQHNATCTNCPAVVSGLFGNALDFDGVDDTASIASTDTLSATSQTLSLMTWINPDVIPSSGVARFITYGNAKAVLRISGGQLHFYMVLDGTFRHIFAPNLLQTDTWQHIAGTYDGEAMYLYYNGLEVGTLAVTGTLATGTNLVFNSGAEPYDGQMDEVALYNRALSSAEIYNLAQSSIAGVNNVQLSLEPVERATTLYNQPLPANTVAYLPFEEASEDALGNITTQFYDYSGVAHHATCSSSTTCPTAQVNGFSGNALNFDGQDDMLTIANSTDFNTNSQYQYFTLGMWFKADDKTLSSSQQLYEEGGGTNGLSIYIEDSAIYAGIWNAYTSLSPDFVSSTQIESGQWHHVTIVLSSTTSTAQADAFKVYLDGNLIGSVASSYLSAHTNPIGLGATNGGTRFHDRTDTDGGNYFAGSIDAFFRVNVPLSQAEIKAIAYGGHPVLNLPFDESFTLNGSTLNDQASLGHSPTLVSDEVTNKMTVGTVGGYALSLNGNDYVNITNTTHLDFSHGQFTQMAWIYPSPDDTDNFHGIMGYHGASDATRAPSLYVQAQTGLYGGFGDGTTWNTLSIANVITENAWNHVAATFDGTTYALYVNGALVNSTTAFAGKIPYPTTDFTVGAVGGLYFEGAIDEVRLYPRPLSTAEIALFAKTDWQTATLSNNNGTWAYTLTDNWEGYTEINIRSTDANNNQSPITTLWRGMLDTQAPAIQVSATIVNTETVYSYTISDFNLDQATVTHPCTTADLTPTYYNAVWYRAILGQTSSPSSQLINLQGFCTNPDTSSPISVTACDSYGHCTTANATPTARSQESGVRSQDSGGYERLISEAKARQEAVLRDTRAATITIDTLVLTRTHYHPNGKLDLSGTVVDNVGVDNVTVIITGTETTQVGTTLDGNTWTALWYLGHEQPDGINYTVTAIATDLAGITSQTTAQVLVDVKTPEAITLTLTYSNGISVNPADTIRTLSPTLTLNWTPSSDGSVVDHYNVAWIPIVSNTTDIITFGTTLLPYQTSYTPADGLKLTPQVGSVDSLNNINWQNFGPVYIDSPYTPDYTALGYDGWLDSECTLIGVDRRINQNTTPAHILHGEQKLYFTWDAEALRLAWTGANWETDGDLFIYLDTVENVGTNVAYNPYPATISNTTIYLPGVTPFSQSALKSTESQLAPLPVQPRTTFRRSLVSKMQAGPMLANYLVWIQDQSTATLLTWDTVSESWLPVGDATDLGYQFDSYRNGGQTDIRLPFSSTNIIDPATNTLEMLAFATANDALRLWSALPAVNTLNQAQVIDHGAYANNSHAFALSHYYSWQDLAANRCPNGRLSGNGTPTANQYLDAPLDFNLSVDPTGTTYSYLGDNLFWLWQSLLGTGPDLVASGPSAPGETPLPPPGRDNQVPQFANLRINLTDVDHSLVGDNTLITYTIEYHNQGTHPSTGLSILASTFYALRLPNGQTILDEKRDEQVIAIGEVAPAQSGQIYITALVDVDHAYNTYYLTCQAENPGAPAELCDIYLDIAAVDFVIYDDAHPDSGQPIEWLWTEHTVDHEAPNFFGYQIPDYQVALTSTLFSGYAYDPSGVAQITLEFDLPGNQLTQIVCPDNTPHNGNWSCTVDMPALNGISQLQDGDTIRLSLQATDTQGNSSPWSRVRTLTLDTTPAESTGLVNGQALSNAQAISRNDNYTIFGTSTDNHDIGQIEVCVDNRCHLTPVDADKPVYQYEDTPASPIRLDSTTSCQGTHLLRTFTVTDSFDIGTLEVGLNISHNFRNDLKVTLTGPDGNPLPLVENEGNSYNTDANYSVWLADFATIAYHAPGNTNPDVPGYDRLGRPHRELATLYEQPANGLWTLDICDAIPDADDGWYNHAVLSFTPANYGDTQGGWRYPVKIDSGLDNVTQQISLTPIDSVGNRNATVLQGLVTVDNVPPVITITGILTPYQSVSVSGTVITQISASNPNPTLFTEASHLISGQVSDGSPLQNLSVLIQAPFQSVQTINLPPNRGDWTYTLQAPDFGLYTVWLRAIDEAGNIKQVGPYQFKRYNQFTEKVYLPIIIK